MSTSIATRHYNYILLIIIIASCIPKMRSVEHQAPPRVRLPSEGYVARRRRDGGLYAHSVALKSRNLSSEMTTDGGIESERSQSIPNIAVTPSTNTTMHLTNVGAETSACEYVLGPVDIGFCTLCLERRSALRVLTLSICANGAVPVEDTAIHRGLQFFDEVLLEREPFATLWDVSRCTWKSIPSSAHVRCTLDWAASNRHMLDDLLRAVTVKIRGHLTRSLARFFVQLCKPAQPVLICSDEHQALQFVSVCARYPKRSR